MKLFLLFSLSFLSAVTGARKSGTQHLRSLGTNNLESYYDSTALDFLVEYGTQYKLFDLFFSSLDTKSSKIKQNVTMTSLRGFATKKASIAKQFKTLNYSSFKSWELVTAKVKSEYKSMDFTYKPKAINEEIIEYNNRFRWGPGIDDRFMTITFDRDPWTDPWTESTQNDLAYLYFVGVNTDLADGNYYYWAFKSPRSVSRCVRPRDTE